MKNNVKRIILAGILLIGLTGCQGKLTDSSSNTNNECNNKAKLLVEQKDKKIYTYCLNDVTIEINNKEENLKKFIETDEKAIDKIIDTLEFKDAFSDGGTKLYRGEKLTLVKCNTLLMAIEIFILGTKIWNSNRIFVTTTIIHS